MRVRTEHKAIELFQRSRKVSELLSFLQMKDVNTNRCGEEVS
ncbi:hypothetical protein FFONT_1315 [Fervidicoccus fontis Kam940]|uniref:Uncharacterized protein n=1 Tax=Fervidicoccus fontis (strain DSM 19380 / JCM 18336 / VKM B-2539 / Kam940) TaxID=1163730 RepID=I0A2U6_FERFK|nr:hypothetical protein FFONT_1315 [Fervidicoccus fontis Kam940]